MKYLKKLLLLFMAIILLFTPSLVYAVKDKTDDEKNNINQGVKDVTYDDSISIDNGDNELTGGTTDSNLNYYRTVAGYLAKKSRGSNPYVDASKYPYPGGKHEDALIEAHYDNGKDNYDDAHLLAAARKLGLKPNKDGIAIGYINCIIKVVKNGKAKFYSDYKSAWNAMVDAGIAGRASEKFKEERYNRRIEIKYPTLVNLKVTLNKYENGTTSEVKTTLATQLYSGSSFRIDNTNTTMPEYIESAGTRYRLYSVKTYDGLKLSSEERFDIDKKAFISDMEYAKKLKTVRNQLHKVNNSDITIKLYYKKVANAKYPVSVILREGTGAGKGIDIKTTDLAQREEGKEIKLDSKLVPNAYQKKKPVYYKFAKDNKVMEQGTISDIAQFRGVTRKAFAGHTKIIVYYNKTGGEPSGSPGGNPGGNNPNETGSNDGSSVDYMTPTGLSGVIKADTRDHEQFDVSKGIPVTESEYTCVVGQKYLVKYVLNKKTGTTTYNRSWEVVVGTDPKGTPITSKETATDVREYSYWTVADLKVYAIDRAEVSNYSFHGNKVVLKPKHYKEPSIVINNNGGIRQYPQGSSDSPEPYGQYEVANDELSIDGYTIMLGTKAERHTNDPRLLPRPKSIDRNVLFQEGLAIPQGKENGNWESEGVLVYRKIYGTGSEELKFPVNINEVVIHTPTVCYPSVSNEKKWNQMITPDKSKPSFVLDRTFSITMPTTGSHRAIKGYGNRDYKKYIKERQVRFPFDVYKNGENGTYVKANTWITVGTDTTTYYLPTWVKEGYHNIEFRSIAVNAKKNTQVEENANKNLEHYVATKTITVQVSGRVFGFAVYDISDYPLWQDVFRIPHTTKLTGVRYRVGTKTRNGIANHLSEQLTLPLLPGSHPKYECQGAVPLGYVTRFSIYTIGNMTGKEDSIEIKPRFYYVTKDGKQKEEVDLWYCETFEGEYQRFVKVGSKRDRRNIKRLQIGSLYRGATPYEIHNTENILGMGKYELYDAKVPVYTFGKISIPWQMRTFVGTKDNRPKAVSDATVRKSFQKWYGEYYLPATLYAVKKDFDIWDWARKYGKLGGGINGLESFWKSKKGYILVNFDIETVKDGKSHLSYINRKNERDGYCNMWKTTGFRYQKKDCKGNLFTLQDGDYAFFNLNRSVKDDYVSGGTH